MRLVRNPPIAVTPALTAKLDAKISRTDRGCWLWTGPLKANGYGSVGIGGRKYQAHRAVYELHRGPIADGMQLDHLCCVRACVNPAHLEPVSPSENIRRSTNPDVTRERHRARTHCAQGHPFDEKNTRMGRHANGAPVRICRACRAALMRAKRARGSEGRP